MKSVNPSTPLRVNGERSRTIKFITLGCKVNQYDTQSMIEQFAAAGYRPINNGEKADVYVINTCTVTAVADRKSRHMIHCAYRQNPKAKIIVTGCYAELDEDKVSKIPGVTYIVKNQDKNRIAVLLKVKKGLNDSGEYGGTGISKFSGHTRAFIKIQDGCNNRCSYCKVPLVRGASRSRPLDDITWEAEALVKNGFKEIVLCGICLGSYGKDLQGRKSLVDVISALEKIRGLQRIRLSSIEAGDVSGELIDKMAESKKLCKHLHIPIQSGDDEILKKMNRNYRRQDYLNIIRKIRAKVAEVAITTDVIVGFPGEREDNFENTVSLVRRIMPLRVHTFPYSARPGTPAGLFKDKISQIIIKKRISHLAEISNVCASTYKGRFLNKKRDALIEGRSKGDDKYWEGYTDNYIKVRVETEGDLKNQLVCVRFKKIYKDCIEADLL